MPFMNGYDSTKILKQMVSNDEIDPINIVACTADITEFNKDKCKEVGFDDFLNKPVPNPELDRILKKYIKG